MSDGTGHQGPYGAIAELAKDVGAVSAQIGERVTYKELMTQNTEQRREITAKIDKVEEHLSETVRQSVDALSARIESLVARMEAYAQQQATLVTTQRGGSGKFAVGSIATLAGSAIGVGGYLLLRSFGVAP